MKSSKKPARTSPNTLEAACIWAIENAENNAVLIAHYRVRLALDHRCRRRFTMLVLGTFAAISLGLAVIGIYGFIAYLVGQGSREVGIRLALGATPGNIKALIVGGGMTRAFWGVGIGIAGALTVSRLMRSLLFGVGANDLVTFVAVPLLLASIAFVASYIPPPRASRIDPSISLRCE